MSGIKAQLTIIALLLFLLGAGAGAVHALLGVYPSTTTIESETYFQDQPPEPKHPGALHIPILIYHSVRPDYPEETSEQRLFNIPPDVLDQQLTFLEENGYTVISMDDLVQDLLLGNTRNVTKPVVLTFDDGWKNQYNYAFPVLKAHHVTATFYVFTNPIMHEKPTFMSWDNLREMHTAGMTIGSHTITHPYLSKLSYEQLSHEVIDSKKIIEDHLGIVVKHFASPFGYSDDALVSLLKQAGYVTGRTTYKGGYHTKDELLYLPGFMVLSRDMNTFKGYLSDTE